MNEIPISVAVLKRHRASVYGKQSHPFLAFFEPTDPDYLLQHLSTSLLCGKEDIGDAKHRDSSFYGLRKRRGHHDATSASYSRVAASGQGE